MPKSLKILLTLIFSVILLLGFTETANLVTGNWYQQFIPNIGSRQITDMTFTDSLTGYAVATQMSDTSYILKTTDGGNNWQIVYRNFFAMTIVQFLNADTGYAGGGYLYKTTNGGLNWAQVNTPAVTVQGMFVLNQDTIWFVNSPGFGGGIFRTTNGGVTWTQQYGNGGSNPDKIYMYNRNTGFASTGSSTALLRTSNSGVNWVQVAGTDGFLDMHFADSLTGWKSNGSVKKTTDGGMNWIQQSLPSGGNLLGNALNRFSVVNRDTLLGVGGSIIIGSQARGIIYRTTNGGQNWLFQIPDTAIHINGPYSFIQFVNTKTGWAYTLGTLGGIHTTTGGDPVWLTDVKQISNLVPQKFKLYQNFPNPFNPTTLIKYQIVNNNSVVKLSVFDLTGKIVMILVNEVQRAGTYQTDFSGSSFASGIYFYKMEVNTGREVYSETKKMIMIK